MLILLRRHAKLHLARPASDLEIFLCEDDLSRFTQHHIEMMDPAAPSKLLGAADARKLLQMREICSQCFCCWRSPHKDSDAVTHMRKLGSGGIKEAKSPPKV